MARLALSGEETARFRDEDLGDKWIEKANTWIEAHRAQPFFLFFASHDLHVPRMPHERFQCTTKLGFRGDSIAEFDWSVGELMKTLDRLEVRREGDLVLVAAAARSFLHHQVRSMVGCLAFVGMGRWTVDDLQVALEAKDRAALALNAPPDGLYFVRAVYP